VDLGIFDIYSKEMSVPLVTFALKDKTLFDEYHVADHLKQFGWVVPAYTMSPNLSHVSMLRVLVREDFSRALADRFFSDLQKTLQYLTENPPPKHKAPVRAEKTHVGDPAAAFKGHEAHHSSTSRRWRAASSASSRRRGAQDYGGLLEARASYSDTYWLVAGVTVQGLLCGCHCAGVTVLVALCGGYCAGATVLVSLCWCHCAGVTVLVSLCLG